MSSKYDEAGDGMGQRRKKPWSLAARLTAWYAVTAFILVSAAGAVLYFGLKEKLRRNEDQFLILRIHVIQSLLRNQRGDATGLKWIIRSEPLGKESSLSYARILDPAGNIVAEAPGMNESLPARIFPAPNSKAPELYTGVDVRGLGGKPFRVMSSFIPAGEGIRESRIVQVSLDAAADRGILARFRLEFAFVLAGTLLLSVLGGMTIARRGTRTVKIMSETAGRIRNTNLNERLEPAGLPAELVGLASSFNSMLDRLEESFTRLSHFSADLAHELRTPLNNLRGEAEVALSRPRSPEEYGKILESSLEEYARLSHIIDSLLFIARAERPESQIKKSLVNIQDELEKMREFYQPAVAEKGVRLVKDCASALFVRTDCALIERALGNLIENALAHTPPSGEIHLRAERRDSQVRIEVADTGEGISPEHLPHIFDRFYRAGRSGARKVPGTGLGLAIVKSVATMHGGSVNIASEVGKGTSVEIRLPLAEET